LLLTYHHIHLNDILSIYHLDEYDDKLVIYHKWMELCSVILIYYPYIGSIIFLAIFTYIFYISRHLEKENIIKNISHISLRNAFYLHRRISNIRDRSSSQWLEIEANLISLSPGDMLSYALNKVIFDNY
jgi:hypothetical protein